MATVSVERKWIGVKYNLMPSLSQWFKLIRILNKAPITVNDLDLETDVSKSRLYSYMRLLREMGIVELEGIVHRDKKTSGYQTVNMTTENLWQLSWIGKGLMKYIREMKL